MENGQKKNGTAAIASGLGWSFAQRILPQLVTLLVSIVLARVLSPEHYGTIAIVTVFIAIGDALVIGGFGNALVQKKDATDTDFNSICWVSLLLSVSVYGVLFLFAPLMARFYADDILTPVIRVMGLKFVFSAFNSVQVAYVQRNMMFRKNFISTLGGTLVSSVVGVTMALTGFGVWALVAQNLTNAVIHTVVLFFIIDWKPKLELCWKSVKELWNYGVKVLGATLVYTLRDNIRTLLVGKQFSSEDLAYYNQGQKYPALLMSDIVSATETVLFPVLSENQTQTKKLKELMRNAIRISSYILTPLMVGFLAVSHTFVEVFLTEKWLPCVPFMQIMCVVYMTRCVSTILQRGLLAIGRSSLNLIHEVVTSFATIVCLLVAVFLMNSVVVIALSQVFVMLLGLVLYSTWSRKYLRYGYKELLRDYLPSVLLSVVMAIVVCLAGMLPIHSLVKLIVQVLAGIVAYVGASIATRNPTFCWLKNYLMNLLHKREHRSMEQDSQLG